MGKGEHERQVFLEFCSTASLPVNSSSVETRTPPEPDIRCMMAGQAEYYELARVLDEEIPKERIEALRRAPELIRPRLLRIGVPERDVLQQKLGKTYRTDGLPVDLLLYFDAEN